MPSRPEQTASPEPDPASRARSLVIRLGGKTHTLEHEPGDTILDALRRAGVRAPFNCQQGNCGTCIARVTEGTAEMRLNNVLDDDEVEEGWVLTCQATPTSRQVVIVYED
jgi:ferredoxin